MSNYPPSQQRFGRVAAIWESSDGEARATTKGRGKAGISVVDAGVHVVVGAPARVGCVPSRSLTHPLTYQNPPWKPLKDTEEPKKDQQKETPNKGARDTDPSKKVSDDLLPHILNLLENYVKIEVIHTTYLTMQYGSRALPRDFEIYAPTASFEDPLMCARGVKQIKSVFYSLSKAFSESRIVEYNIKENILLHGRREILIDNKQYYKFMGKDIDMISLIKLYVEDGKVIRHEDWWDKKPLWNRENSKVPFCVLRLPNFMIAVITWFTCLLLSDYYRSHDPVNGQMDRLTKRQLTWNASFQSLYVMLRKNICNFC